MWRSAMLRVMVPAGLLKLQRLDSVSFPESPDGGWAQVSKAVGLEMSGGCRGTGRTTARGMVKEDAWGVGGRVQLLVTERTICAT